MVSNTTSLTGHGLRDWLLQRISAVVLAFYSLFLVGYLIAKSPLQFADWQMLFESSWMRIASIIVLLSLCVHAWIGIWTVFTDYVKCTKLRLTLHGLVLLALLGYVFWGIEIVWGLL